MTMSTKGSFLAISMVALGLLGAPLGAAPELPYGTRARPLEGQRYLSLSALARQLEENARGALDGARRDGGGDDARDRATSAARVLPSIRSFAQGAADLRRKLDSYRALPFEVPPEVDALMVSAEELSEGIRSAQTLTGTYADWEAVLDTLVRMKLVLDGAEVDEPSAYAVDALSGSRLEEFRQLAHDVEGIAGAAHETAGRQVGDYRDRGQQYLGELRYFASRSRDLRQRSEAGAVDPRELGPVVDRLLEEARVADRAMRDAGVFPSVWVGSGSTITILHRMASLVRP